jgi:hypothetical protein
VFTLSACPRIVCLSSILSISLGSRLFGSVHIGLTNTKTIFCGGYRVVLIKWCFAWLRVLFVGDNCLHGCSCCFGDPVVLRGFSCCLSAGFVVHVSGGSTRVRSRQVFACEANDVNFPLRTYICRVLFSFRQDGFGARLCFGTATTYTETVQG